MTTTRTEYAVKRERLSLIVTLSDGRARRAMLSLDETAEPVADCDRFKLLTHSNGELEETDFEAFGAQCGKFTKTICGICHDRFIIVDQKEIFWTGASLKDAGRLTFAARMLAHPSGSAFAESSLRNALHFFRAFQRWARRSSPDFSIQSARRHQKGGNMAKAREYWV